MAVAIDMPVRRASAWGVARRSATAMAPGPMLARRSRRFCQAERYTRLSSPKPNPRT